MPDSLLRARPITAALAVALLALAARADVLVVDWAGGPGADHTNLAQAIAVAADGDVLLVRPGLYDVWSTVSGRSLTLAGDGPNVQVSGQLTVRDLAADQAFVMRGLELRYPGGVDVLDCAGPALIEDCVIQADLSGGSGPYGAVRVDDARVVLSDCSVQGAWQYWIHGAPPTAGIHAVDAEVVVHGGFVIGGGGVDTYGDDVPGAPALQLQGSTAVVSGATITGGLGNTQPGGAGVLADGGSVVTLRESPTAGGTGAPDGAAQVVSGGSTLLQPLGAATALQAPSPVREGDALVVDVAGAPGDGVWVSLALTPAWAPLAAGRGVWTAGAPFVLLSLGVLGAGGSTGFAVSLPDLGVDAMPLHLQVLTVPGGGGPWVAGDTSTLLLLDAAY